MPHSDASRIKISVVIPTKNRAVDLGRTLASLVAQTRPPDELILVDQSLSDEAKERSGEYAWRRLIHIRDPEIKGLPAARNIGFALSTGDVVCFFDDDITLDARYLAEMERGFELFPEWTGLTGRLTEEGHRPLWRGFKAALFRHRFLRDRRHVLATLMSPRSMRLLPGCAFCLRREVMERFRFDERLEGYALGEDVDFFLRAGRSFSFGALPTAAAHHRRSQVGRAAEAKMYDSVIASAKYLRACHRSNFADDIAYFWFLVGLRFERWLGRVQVEPESRLGLPSAVRTPPDVE
jgi:glycosyltransferase involved in cell wall biosynthesis